MAIIHKTIHPDLAIQKHETKFSLKTLNFGYIWKLEENFKNTGQNLGLGTKEAVKLQSEWLTTLCLRFRPVVNAHERGASFPLRASEKKSSRAWGVVSSPSEREEKLTSVGRRLLSERARRKAHERGVSFPLRASEKKSTRHFTRSKRIFYWRCGQCSSSNLTLLNHMLVTSYWELLVQLHL